MANTKNWVIAALDVAPSEETLTDVVKSIHWRRQATETVSEKTYMADVYGSCAVNTPTPEAFVSYADLTEAEVIAWLEANLDVESIDNSLDAQLENQKNPPIVTKPLPWVPAVVEEITPSQEAAENITE
jgi:hypothetical protein